MNSTSKIVQIRLPTLRTPIPPSPDISDLQKQLTELGVIPYYGNDAATGITFLTMIREACELSSTYQSVIKDLNTFIFGSRAKVAENTVPGLIIDNTDEVAIETQKKVAERLNSIGLGLHKFTETGKLLNRHFNDSGNAYFRIKKSTVAGITKYMLFADHYLCCSYLVPEPGEEDLNLVLISPHLLNLHKMQETQDYRILRAVFPGDKLIWTKTGKNVEEALIHIKNNNGSDKATTYGRSLQISTLLPLLTDHYYNLLTAKISNTEMVTKKMIVFEAPPPEVEDQEEFEDDDFRDGEGELNTDSTVIAENASPRKPVRTSQFDRNVQAVRQITTNLGDAEAVASIGLLEIPNGSEMPKTIDLEMNRDTNYQKYAHATAKRIIASENGWSTDLMNDTVAPSGIGGNILADLFTIKRLSTILPAQEFWIEVFNTVINDIAEAEGVVGYGIQLYDKLGDLINKLTVNKTGNSTTSNGQAVAAQQQAEDVEPETAITV